MNAQIEDSMMVETETEELHSDVHEPAKADMEPLNGNGRVRAKAAGSGHKKVKTTAKRRVKKTTSTARKARSAAQDGATTRASNAESMLESAASVVAAVPAEPKPMLVPEPHPLADHFLKLRTDLGQLQWNQLASRIPRQYLLWLAAVVAVVLLATVGYVLAAKPTHSAAQPMPSPSTVLAASPAPRQPLALTAERRGTDLLLSWNHESASVARASYGMLIIRGKDGRRDIALTPEQLRAGNIVYTPTTDQVQVELSVVADEQVTKDSVIVSLHRKGSKNITVTTAETEDSQQWTVTPPKSPLHRRGSRT